jgi:hypothetical protein
VSQRALFGLSVAAIAALPLVFFADADRTPMTGETRSPEPLRVVEAAPLAAKGDRERGPGPRRFITFGHRTGPAETVLIRIPVMEIAAQ